MSYGAPPPPGYSMGQPMGMPPAKPSNYLVWSILTTLFCCLPFGIVAILSSSKVDSLFSTGQYAAAQAASDSAKKWNIFGVAIGLVVVVAYVLLVVVAGVFSTSTNY